MTRYTLERREKTLDLAPLAMLGYPRLNWRMLASVINVCPWNVLTLVNIARSSRSSTHGRKGLDMREKVDFGRATGLDCGNEDTKETGIDRQKIIVWLLTNHQPMGKNHSWNLAYCINKVLIDEGKIDLSVEESKKIASKLILSKLSKSNIRIKLIALEYYMEYIGKPTHSKKPRDTKRSPKFLTEAQMQKLVHSSRNYWDVEC